MWHEARKQEKKIRGMLVDYRKRAERRQDFYERIKADPTQFLQVHGRKCKIHLDASVATAAENPAIMMPWQGQKDNLIDRFDVRAHLDYIAPIPHANPEQTDQQEEDAEERAMNYERYRVLAQNEFLGIVEEKYLHQLYLEEQFGVNAQIEAESKASAAAAKKKSAAGAAIGYTYEETETVAGSTASGGSGTSSVPFAQSITAIEKSSEASSGTQGSSGPVAARFDECMKDESDSDLDMDVSIDINKIGTNQAHELNTCGRQYGMKSNDFYSFLTKDADEADALRMAREEEQEKIMFSGRKSRRERRAQRERKVAGRPLSPPSYAAKEDLVPRMFVETNDSSRSPSPVNSGKITYITSFGGEEELQPHGKISFALNRDMSTLGGIAGTSKGLRAGATGAGGESGGTLSYADKVKQNLEKLKAQQSAAKAAESDRKPPVQYQRSASTRDKRGSSSRSSSSSSSRSRSRSRRRRRSSSSSRSRSRDRSKSPPAGRRRRSRSPRSRRTYSRYRRRSKSVSRSRSRSRSRSHSRTRSKASRWSPRRRYPPAAQSTGHRKRTPSRSSSSSTSSSRSRSRSESRNRSPPARTKRAGGSGGSDSDSSRVSRKDRTPIITVTQEKLPLVVPQAVLGALPPPPPPPPLPVVASAPGSGNSSSGVVEEKKPIPSLALLEPEPEVPIKRYYGRRRGDESSSDEASSSGDDRKPPAGLPSVKDASGEDDTTGTGSSIKSSGGFDFGTVQIKQEKPDAGTGDDLPGGDSSAGGGSASLRFGKTVTGGTSAPESKVGIVASCTAGGAPSSKSFNPRDRLKRKMQILLNKQYKADKKAEIEKVERQIQQQQERDDEMRELALKLRRRQRELRHKYGTPESEHSKSHSSEERSSDEAEDGAGQQLPQFGQPPPAADDGSKSPHRPPPSLLPSLTSIPPPKMALHSRPPPALHSSMPVPSGGPGCGNSVVIERKPVLRSATNMAAAAPPAPVQVPFGGDMGRLRRRNSPALTGGSSSTRGYGGHTRGLSPSMNLRRGGGGGPGPGPVSGTGRPMQGGPPGGRFDDRNRRRSPPSRYDRSRSKSRERLPQGPGGGGRGGGRRGDYGRTREYDRYHGYGAGGGPGGAGYQSGFGGGGRYRGRRSRSGSRGRRSRSPARQPGTPIRTTRGNGGGGGGGSGSVTSGRQTDRAAKPVKKLVDY